MRVSATATLRTTTATVENGSRLSWFVVAAISTAIFGPYIVGGVRTEQICVYGLALLLPFTWNRLQVRGGTKILLLWTLYIVVAVLGVVFPVTVAAKWGSGSVLAGLDNIILPLMLMLLIWSIVPPQRAESLLQTASRIISLIMAANGALAIISTRVDITKILRPFWTAGNEMTSVAQNASTMGRYSGILNQPVEAGTLYGFAAIAAIYVWRRRPLRLAIVLSLIILGGLISVSKIFVLGALPLMIFYWVWSLRGSRRLGLVLGGALFVFGALQSALFNQWSGFSYLERLFKPVNWYSAIELYTAGRLGSDSGISQVVKEVLSINPLSGVGAGGWLIPYDGAVTEALVVGGVAGLALYGAIIVGVFVLARSIVERNLRMLATLFGSLLICGSLGFSPLTANRVSSAAWLIISLLVLCSDNDQDLLQDATLPEGHVDEPLTLDGRDTT